MSVLILASLSCVRGESSAVVPPDTAVRTVASSGKLLVVGKEGRAVDSDLKQTKKG